MQRFLVKQGICAAICLTMAFSLCVYTAAGTMSEASITIAAEMSTRPAERFERSAEEKLNTAKKAVQGFFGTAPAPFMLLKAEVTKAIIPEP